MYGADRILLQMVTRLKEFNFEPVVVIPTDVPYEKTLSLRLLDEGIKVIYFKTAVLRRIYFSPIGLIKYIFRFFATLFFLVKVIRENSISIVHSNTLSVIPGAFAAKITRLPHVWHVHEIIVNPKKLHQLTAWLALKFSDKVVAVSTPTYEHVIQGTKLDPDHVVVLNNGIEVKRFDEAIGIGQAIRDDWQISDNQVLVGMVGRISRWKGQDHFLKACKLVNADDKDIRFCLVGDAPHGQEFLVESLKTTIQRSNLEKNCILGGFRDDIPVVLDALDIFVMPSTLPDPFPTTILEAMAASKPIVANAHGGAVEMVEEGATGYLVDPNDPQEMADRILHLTKQSKQYRAEMGEKGRKRLENYFSVDSFLHKWVEIYEELS